MKKYFMFFVCMLFSISGYAESQVLWDKVEYGMTFEQVAEVYRDFTVPRHGVHYKGDDTTSINLYFGPNLNSIVFFRKVANDSCGTCDSLHRAYEVMVTISGLSKQEIKNIKNSLVQKYKTKLKRRFKDVYFLKTKDIEIALSEFEHSMIIMSITTNHDHFSL